MCILIDVTGASSCRHLYCGHCLTRQDKAREVMSCRGNYLRNQPVSSHQPCSGYVQKPQVCVRRVDTRLIVERDDGWLHVCRAPKHRA